jgi:hypothetical protein
LTQLLGRDAILQAPDITTEDVAVPEWGGTVRVKGLNASERDAFEASSVTGKGKNQTLNLSNLRARLAALTIVNEDGETVFSPSDVKALGQKSAAPIDRIFEVASRLSGISESDVEDLTGNSEPGQSDGSSSA